MQRDGLLRDVSVVIPVGAGERAWEGLLGDLRSIAPGGEIVMAAAEPVPGTLQETCASAGVGARIDWIASRPGRAVQLNAGAAAATNRFLWFLHADSRVDRAALEALELGLRIAPAALHYFDLRFLNDGPTLTRLNALGAGFRSRVLGLPFGDQGLCLDRELFQRLGGFDEGAPYGEDHLLVWAARHRRVRLRPTGASIRTSARRYRENGWLRTTGRHLALTARQAGPEFLRLMTSRIVR